MQFNGHASNYDLYSEARDWCGLGASDTTSLPLITFTRSANIALDRCHSLILTADGKWQYDDSNNSAELIDTSTNLVSGTYKYAIAATWLKISRVRVKDSAGNWQDISQIDRRNLSSAQLALSGTPTSYDLLGNWVNLNPTPNYASSGGLEVTLQKGPSYFVTTDTTKTPGFASIFHSLLALYPSLDYCEKNSMDKRASAIARRIGFPPKNGNPGAGLEGEMVNFYARRNQDGLPQLSVRKEDYGQVELGGGGRASSNPEGFF